MYSNSIPVKTPYIRPKILDTSTEYAIGTFLLTSEYLPLISLSACPPTSKSLHSCVLGMWTLTSPTRIYSLSLPTFFFWFLLAHGQLGYEPSNNEIINGIDYDYKLLRLIKLYEYNLYFKQNLTFKIFLKLLKFILLRISKIFVKFK